GADRADLLPEARGGEAAGHGRGPRMVGDDDVLVTPRLRGRDQGLDWVVAVRPLGVSVEVAAEVADLDQGRETPAQGGLDLSGILAELGGNPGEPHRAVELLLGRPRHPAAALVEDAVLVHLQLLPAGHLT